MRKPETTSLWLCSSTTNTEKEMESPQTRWTHQWTISNTTDTCEWHSDSRVKTRCLRKNKYQKGYPIQRTGLRHQGYRITRLSHSQKGFPKFILSFAFGYSITRLNQMWGNCMMKQTKSHTFRKVFQTVLSFHVPLETIPNDCEPHNPKCATWD
jgi:hypothetical protein